MREAACRWRSEKLSNGDMEVEQLKLDTTEGLVKFNMIWDCPGQPMTGGLRSTRWLLVRIEFR